MPCVMELYRLEQLRRFVHSQRHVSWAFCVCTERKITFFSSRKTCELAPGVWTLWSNLRNRNHSESPDRSKVALIAANRRNGGNFHECNKTFSEISNLDASFLHRRHALHCACGRPG